MPEPVFEMTEYAHTLPLDLMMWNGVPLGLALCGALVWWLARHVLRLRDHRTTFALAVVLVIGSYALVEFPHAYAYFLLPLGLMMGAADYASPVTPAYSMPRVAHGAQLAILTVFGLLVARDYARLDADFREMRLSFFGLEMRRSPEEAPQVVVLDHLRAFLVFARTPVDSKQSAASLAKQTELVDRFPHPPLLVRYAVTAARHGRPDQAREAMDRLCTLHTTAMCYMGHRDWRTWARDDPLLKAVNFE
jgi:hypothetical protein